MIESIINEFNNDFAHIKDLLKDNNLAPAEELLAQTAQHLKLFKEFSGNFFNLERYIKELNELVDQFTEVSMSVTFASSYRLIYAYKNALVDNDQTEAANLLPQIEYKIRFMNQAYLDAIKAARSQTSAFINFEKDFSQLLGHLEEAKNQDKVLQVCSNIEKALNFKKTQQLFFYNPPKNVEQTIDAHISMGLN
ncbi:hypothetical protein TUM19329_14200 [Legionella antarctica]|uniref:Uncharacterized protein n=1 Tax=Legionella antarctica TaxID=2708020 RepID=A0A6F8T3N8_9GAMM|nr:hypothetical protein [Legionella antarctica]BCA95059.1 hypothetical protein TUM19329_14200 [Legionella antarctica]